MQNRYFKVVVAAILLLASKIEGLPVGLHAIGDPITSIDFVNSVAWCSSCEFLAAGTDDGAGSGTVSVFSFDPQNPDAGLTFVTSIDQNPAVNAVAWCPNCDFLAAGGVAGANRVGPGLVQVYSFDGSQLVTAGDPVFTSAHISALKWCGNCQFLAVAGDDDGGFLSIYGFDTSVPGDGLTELSTVDFGGGTNVYSLDWCPDCNYVAIGGFFDGEGLQIYSFDPLNPIDSLVLVTEALVDITVTAISWCDCNYLAVAMDNAGTESLQIYSFNQQNQTLTPVGNPIEVATSRVNSVAWCGTCEYLTIGTEEGTVLVYRFDPTTGLTLFGSTEQVGTVATSLAWCGDCDYLSVGGDTDTTGIIQLFELIRALPAPSNLTGQQCVHRFPTQSDIINSICWDAVTGAVSYNIYDGFAMAILLGTVSKSPLCFTQHQICPNVSKTYVVTAVDAQGVEGLPASITVQ